MSAALPDAPPPAIVFSRSKNCAASVVLVALACAIYSLVPYNQEALSALHGWVGFSFTGVQFLANAALIYAALLAIYFFSERDPAASKSLRFVQLSAAFVLSPLRMYRAGLSRQDRLAVLVTLLKGYFGPMMAMSLMAFCMGALENGRAIASGNAFDHGFRALFDQYGFWFLMQLILFVDVLVFTVGYLVELPRLGNEIRSVDPTFIGWAAALLCYPPFNSLTSVILGSPVSDFPHFDNPTAHVALNLLLLALMAVYAWASVALCFKASNLTHRGIIRRGPYTLIRHPAYVCKNMAWWIGAVPAVSAAYAHSTVDGMAALGSMIGWTMLYVLRALTEEDHLKRVDGEYAAYAAKVRFRFIPGVV